MSVIHRCPPLDAAVTPCCGSTPFELPATDRMTTDDDIITCTAALGRCDPPAHAWEWTGSGTVHCECGETTAELADGPDGGWRVDVVSPGRGPLVSADRERLGPDLHITGRVESVSGDQQ